MQVMTTLTTTVTPPLTTTMVTTPTHMVQSVLVSSEWPRAIDTVEWVCPIMHTLEVRTTQYYRSAENQASNW